MAYIFNLETNKVAVVELKVTEAGTYPAFPTTLTFKEEAHLLFIENGVLKMPKDVLTSLQNDGKTYTPADFTGTLFNKATTFTNVDNLVYVGKYIEDLQIAGQSWLIYHI